MKLTIKTTLYIYFCFSTLVGQTTGDNYKVFNRLINETKIKDHYSINEIRTIFENPNLKQEPQVLERFRKKPEKVKTYKQYRKIFVTEDRLSNGVSFYFQNKELLNKIMLEFDIDPLILVAIAGIETSYGKKYAEYSVFNSLYTQVINLPKRSSWATKELFELLLYSKEQNINPFETRGSYAGAFGYGQFIPSSFNRLSIDYNRDGTKDPYNWEDVLGSIAHYLTENGYPKNNYNFSFRSPAWRSIRTYNRSDKYANTVIDFRNELSKKVFLSY
jgi:membrane-bound lytic murein transglycosylase B